MNKPCNKCEYAYSYQYKSGNVRYYARDFGEKAKICRECEKYKKYNEYLESRRRYYKGEPIKSVEEYLALKAKGETMFYLRDAIRHYGWIESLQFHTFMGFMNHGTICRANKK